MFHIYGYYHANYPPANNGYYHLPQCLRLSFEQICFYSSQDIVNMHTNSNYEHLEENVSTTPRKMVQRIRIELNCMSYMQAFRN